MDIIPEMHYDWDSQACQYAPTGEPGVKLETHTLAEGTRYESKVDCILYRDDEGQLIGILNRYYENNRQQKNGTGNLWVKPDCHHNGVATALLREAARIYPEAKLAEQTFTHAGIAWVQSLVDKGVINQEKTEFIDEE